MAGGPEDTEGALLEKEVAFLTCRLPTIVADPSGGRCRR
jgi:hypothetical protein